MATIAGVHPEARASPCPCCGARATECTRSTTGPAIALLEHPRPLLPLSRSRDSRLFASRGCELLTDLSCTQMRAAYDVRCVALAPWRARH
eukprot:458411-Pleurochrysis_carterae.AAC.1